MSGSGRQGKSLCGRSHHLLQLSLKIAFPAQLLPDEARQKLADSQKVKEALISARFNQIELHREIVEETFRDLRDLLRWIKGIGANRLHANVSVNRESLKRASRLYQDRFA